MWLQTTTVRMDGSGWGEDASYNYTCVTDTGEVSSTAYIIRNFDAHWRRCVGSRILGVAVAVFLLLLLALMTSLMVIRSWTHLCYLWKVGLIVHLSVHLFAFLSVRAYVYYDSDIKAVVHFDHCRR